MMRTLLLLTLVACLTACGFQLRGDARLPAVMQQTWLVSPDDSSAFVRELSLVLRANGVDLQSTPTDGAAELRIHAERLRSEALTIAAGARVREFILIFDVEFELFDSDGEVLIPRETLRLTRDYSFDEQEILAATREEEFLRNDLRQSMAARMLRRLESI